MMYYIRKSKKHSRRSFTENEGFVTKTNIM